MALATPSGVKDPNAPKFSWDHDIPEIPFWSDLKYTTGRNFLQCLDPSSIDSMSADFGRLGTSPKEDKVAFLIFNIESSLSRLADAAFPDHLPLRTTEEEYGKWAGHQLALISCYSELKSYAEQEAVIRSLIDKPFVPGSVDYSGLNMLANLKEETGEYAAAEELERKVLPFFEAHEKLGVDSPPAMGTRRCIVRCIWKQGRYDQAREFAGETRRLVEAMSEPGKESKFVKYQGDERQYLDELLEELEAWRREKDGDAGQAKEA